MQLATHEQQANSKCLLTLLRLL